MARKTIFEQQKLDFIDSSEGYYMHEGETSIVFELNTTYYVVWDDIEYNCTTSDYNGEIIFGNHSILNIGEDSKEPFLIKINSTNYTIVTSDTKSNNHTIAIYKDVVENIVIKNPLGKSVTYGEYNNLCVSNANGTKTVFSKLPKVSTEDNGKILGVVNGVWSKIDNSSGQTGTIEKDVTIKWDTSNITTFFDVAAAGFSCYKIADVALTKEQLFAATIKGTFGDIVFDEHITEKSIFLDSEYLLSFGLEMRFGYMFCYQAGDVVVNYQGYDIPISIPEVGMYQLWDYRENLPNTLVGSITYKVTEEVDFVQPDWNQTDNTKPDYIKNKPFGEVQVSETLIDGKYTLTFDEEEGGALAIVPITSDIHLTVGEEYTVLWNGEEYKAECFLVIEGINGIGNPVVLGEENNNLPFAIAEDLNGILFGTPGFMVVSAEDFSATITVNVKVVYESTAIKKIDSKYLPNNIGVQPNWNQNDTSEPDFIKNRPFGVIDIIEEELLPKNNYTFEYKLSSNNKYYYAATIEIREDIYNKWYSDWFSADVEWNGTTYHCSEKKNLLSYMAIGNLAATFLSQDDTGEPFCIYATNNAISVWVCAETNPNNIVNSVRLSINTEVINKIDAKYLPKEVCVPSSSTSDKDKILTVNSEGSAAWAAPIKELPTITADTDEGKFLRVVNGIATWSIVPNAEEASF